VTAGDKHSLRLEPDPPLPRGKGPVPPDWTQRIVAKQAAKPVGELRWTTLARQPGVTQLLQAEVIPDRRRSGIGTRLLDAAVDQMLAYMDRTGAPLRRAVTLVNQPEVIARAWLQRRGFVHVKTLEDLDEHEDVLVMVRTFD
jgi:ribosomal protein S18 acetylase RimI-like enzyme